MKRTFLALLSALTLGFVGLIATPSQAQAVTCTAMSLNVPSKPFTHTALYYCGTVTPAQAEKARDAINDLKDNSRASLDNGHHAFYLFKSVADYAAYAVPPAALPYEDVLPTVQGNTFNDTSFSPSNWWTVIFLNNLDQPTLSADIKNVTAHEAGHHFDFYYSSRVAGAAFASEMQSVYGIKATGAKLTVGGGSPYHLNNKIKLTLSLLDAGLKNYGYVSGAPVEPDNAYLGTYTDGNGATVYSFEKELTTLGETPTSIAAWFVSQINGHPTLINKGIKAFATSPASATFTIHSLGKYVVKYDTAYVGTTFSFQLAEHDWSAFIKLTKTKCGSSGALWRGYKGADGVYICSSTTTENANGDGPFLNTPYAGKDNGEIALKAWPHFYSLTRVGSVTEDGHTWSAWRFAELWAEQTARITGNLNNIAKSPIVPLINDFICTRTLITSLQQSDSYTVDDSGFGTACKGF